MIIHHPLQSHKNCVSSSRIKQFTFSIAQKITIILFITTLNSQVVCRYHTNTVFQNYEKRRHDYPNIAVIFHNITFNLKF